MPAAEKEKDFPKQLHRPIEKPPVRRKFSVDQYLEMIENGFFHPEEKVELIEGELINKMGIGKEHANCVNKLAKYLIKVLLDSSFEVSIQNPIRLEKSRPEPDLVIQTKTSWESDEDPVSSDILLLVEVAQSTLRYDREVKLPIYAQANIPMYWIVNLEAKNVEVYTKPSADTYNEKKVFEPGMAIPLPSIQKEISVSEFLS